MRRYDERVEVRRRDDDPEQLPEQFLWRGRLWQVRAVLAHWVETGEWWRTPQVATVAGPVDRSAPQPPLDPLAQRELWRVEAGRGLLGGTEVVELALDRVDGHWQLVGCHD